MDFSHRIGHIGFNIVKTVALNADVAELAVYNI